MIIGHIEIWGSGVGFDGFTRAMVQDLGSSARKALVVALVSQPHSFPKQPSVEQKSAWILGTSRCI